MTLENISVSESLHNQQNLIRLTELYLNKAQEEASRNVSAGNTDNVSVLVNIKKVSEMFGLLKQHLK